MIWEQPEVVSSELHPVDAIGHRSKSLLLSATVSERVQAGLNRARAHGKVLGVLEQRSGVNVDRALSIQTDDRVRLSSTSGAGKRMPPEPEI